LETRVATSFQLVRLAGCGLNKAKLKQLDKTFFNKYLKQQFYHTTRHDH